MDRNEASVELIKSDGRVRYLADLGAGRHAIDLPHDLIEQHADLVKVRSKSPEDVNLLRDSMEKTGDAPVYLPCVFVEAGEDAPRYWLVDGHQRFRASTTDRMTVQFIDRWKSIDEAFADAVSLNFARYDSGEEDVLSILATGRLTKKEVAERTGLEETRVHRLAKVADHPWLWGIIRKGALGYGVAGKLIDATANNPVKLRALEATLTEEFERCEQEAKRWQDEFKRNRGKKYDAKAKAKARVASYFRKTPWDRWVDLLEDEECGLVRGADGRWRLNLDGQTAAPTSKGVWIGDAKDWEEEFAVFGFFASKVGDIATEDLQKVYDKRDYIFRQIETHLNRRRQAEAVAAHPMASPNPTVTPEIPPAPEPQVPTTRVGRRSKD